MKASSMLRVHGNKLKNLGGAFKIFGEKGHAESVPSDDSACDMLKSEKWLSTQIFRGEQSIGRESSLALGILRKVFLLRCGRSTPRHVPGQLFNGLELSRVIVSVINQKEKILKHLHSCTHISLDKHPWGSITLTTLGNFRSKRKRCSSLFSFPFFSTQKLPLQQEAASAPLVFSKNPFCIGLWWYKSEDKYSWAWHVHKAAADPAPVPSVERRLRAKARVGLKKCNFEAKKLKMVFLGKKWAEKKLLPELWKGRTDLQQRKTNSLSVNEEGNQTSMTYFIVITAFAHFFMFVNSVTGEMSIDEGEKFLSFPAPHSMFRDIKEHLLPLLVSVSERLVLL